MKFPAYSTIEKNVSRVISAFNIDISLNNKKRLVAVIYLLCVLFIAYLLYAAGSYSKNILIKNFTLISGDNNVVNNIENNHYATESRKTVFKYVFQDIGNNQLTAYLHFGTTTKFTNEDDLEEKLFNKIKPDPKLANKLSCGEFKLSAASGNISFTGDLPEFNGLLLYTFFANCTSNSNLTDDGLLFTFDS